jgi:hypothetical protein
MSEIYIPTSEVVPVFSLQTDQKNPNRMSKEQRKALGESIKKYGFLFPIITNKNLIIADGEQKWIVAKDDLGMLQVPVIRLPVTDVDRRILRQVLNKLHGDHAYAKDAAEYTEIIKQGEKENLKLLLQNSDDNLARYLRMDDTPANFEVPPKDLGEIPQSTVINFDEHTLTCGDSFKINHWLMLKPKLVFMDPPWDLSIPDEFIRQFTDVDATVILLHNDKTAAKTAMQFKEVFHYFHVFTRSTAIISQKNIPLQHHTIGVVLAKKIKINPLTPPVSTVFSDYGSPFRYDKNPQITRTIIEAYTNEGDVIIEPFANSPAMLFVCEKLNRIYHGAEIDGAKCAAFKWLWENKHGVLAHAVPSTVPEQAPIVLPTA